mgnify:CR=1 FL=1
MKLSKLASEIAESPTFALNEEARLLRERGEAVINLGIGEPKNKTPITAILSSAAKLTGGEVKYVPTDGTPSLKKAIIHYTEDNYNRVVAPYNVIVSDGAKQSLWNLLFALCNPQDEVIIIAPYWVSYPEMVRMIGAIPVVVTPEDGNFIPRFDEIERVVSSYTKAIIVNSPTSGPGTSMVQILNGIFDELVEALTEGYKSDDKNALIKYAIPTGSGNGWYTATGGGPGTPTIVKPIAGKIILVKTADNRYAKMEILSYYKDAPSNPTGTEPSRYYTFRYVYQPNETNSFK